MMVGRARECSRLEELLAEARSGDSRALVIRGDAGVGKSALLTYASQHAQGMTLLRVNGSEAESELAFAGLFGLLRPILDKIPELPEPQANALSAAFGLALSDAPDRFLVSAAALSLLAVAAEETPLLALIDDAHWLDQPSAEAIVFAARRLHADAVALLFAASEWEGRAFAAPDIPDLGLAGVDAESAQLILQQSAPDLAPGVRTRLLADAAGNPLALSELPHALSEDERGGRDALPEQLPLTPRLSNLFERRIQLVPPAGRTALLVCAVDGTENAGVVLRALSKLGLGPDSLAPAERAGLIRTSDSTIVFRHPLARAAATAVAPLSDRQQAHLALAAALDGEEHLDRRVWHQAMAAFSGDEEVANALEASGQRARERAGYASAASAFQRAAELTRERTRLASRLAAAADAAWNAGQVGRSHALIERALRFADDDLKRQLLHLRGSIETAEGRFRDGATTLLAAAGEKGDDSTTLAILADLGEPAILSGFPDEFVIAAGTRAQVLPTATPHDAFNRSVLLWRMKRFERKFEESIPFYEEVIQNAAKLADDPRVQRETGLLASMTVGPGAGVPQLSRAVELARRQGRVGLLPTLLAEQGLELASASEFDRAYAVASEGLQLALDTQQSPAWHLVALTRVEAVRGDAASARDHANEALVRGGDNYVVAAAVGAALGLLELGLGHPKAAVELMLRASPGDRLAIAWTAAIPDLIEAIVRAGHPTLETTETLLLRLRRVKTTSPILASPLARSEALLATRPQEEAFVEALELANALSPFERARTELLYGEWLRRQRRRKDARTHLRAAAAEFRRLGTFPWQDRADAELRATGETARKRESSTIRDLTPQELQIAQLAAEGQSNPEIAAQLYLSPRTIEYHLGKVFTKLGVSGRTELIRYGGLHEAG